MRGASESDAGAGPGDCAAAGLTWPDRRQVVRFTEFRRAEIMLEFELSPGDSASINAFFQAVPGPAGAAVFALFGLVTGGRRRRECRL